MKAVKYNALGRFIDLQTSLHHFRSMGVSVLALNATAKLYLVSLGNTSRRYKEELAKPVEGKMEKRLRWMSENVQGAYNARHPNGHIKDEGDDHCTNSGTCILVYCYMEALGKVLLKGKHGPRRRFQEFIERCMPDLNSEFQAMGIIKPHVWFYGKFRSAFVHGYPKPDYAWKRGGLGKYFLTDKNRRYILNIDEFVAGFERGIEKFKECAVADPDLRINFIPYITE